MNSETLKNSYSMRSIVEKYGFQPNGAGFISCPFHKDKTASLKVYAKDFHCFGCGENGDIFSFIMRMDGLDFKEAFYSLGGQYEKPSFESKLAIYKHKKQEEQRRKATFKRRERRELNNMLIDVYRSDMNRLEPLSDDWAYSHNKLQYQLYLHDILSRGEGEM